MKQFHVSSLDTLKALLSLNLPLPDRIVSEMQEYADQAIHRANVWSRRFAACVISLVVLTGGLSVLLSYLPSYAFVVILLGWTCIMPAASVAFKVCELRASSQARYWGAHIERAESGESFTATNPSARKSRGFIHEVKKFVMFIRYSVRYGNWTLRGLRWYMETY